MGVEEGAYKEMDGVKVVVRASCAGSVICKTRMTRDRALAFYSEIPGSTQVVNLPTIPDS